MKLSTQAAKRTASIEPASEWPIVGEWYWVKGAQRTKQPTLMCCNHLGSNHAHFTLEKDNWRIGEHVMVDHMGDRLIHEPNWKAILQARADAAQIELRETVLLLANQCSAAKATPDASTDSAPMSLVIRADPEQQKNSLIELRDVAIPAASKRVDELTKEITVTYKNMLLPETIKAGLLFGAVEGIKDRLFALELYAGFEEQVMQIGYGDPAPESTPITIRQMLRFMDEETLIAAEDGGADFSDLQSFDNWVVENLDQVAPEPRCIVAFKVRRYSKNYGGCPDIGTALMHLSFHVQNMQTYLLIRNGGNVYRISTALDFAPRLVPFRAEFTKALRTKRVWSSDSEKEVGPADYEYDKLLKDRTDTIKHYNRILFIVQGLLDRSKVFEPHPLISLADPVNVEKWIHLHYDEEDGLPSANPPQWEAYKDSCNRELKRGSVVFAEWEGEREWRDGRAHYPLHTGFFRVESVARDRKTVKLSKPWGKRWGYQFPNRRWNKGEWGEWEVDKRRHYTVEMRYVFAVEAYKPGAYKDFLCDAYTKGAYLEWAPVLLKAERFHKMPPEKKASF